MDKLAGLQAFSRLVDLGSFSAAARDLRIKQSTVSKWIAALEEELGVRLVERTTRSLRVTDAGRRFYQSAAGVLAAYETAVAQVRHDEAAIHGRIRMSIPVVFGQRFIVPAVTEFLARHERVELELSSSDGYVNLVEEGYDVAIRVGNQVDSSLRTHALGDGQRRLVAARAYLDRHGTPRVPRDLARHQCLVHNEAGAGATWTFKKGSQRQRVRVAGRVSTNHSESALYMARAGFGVALLAGWLVEGDLQRGSLVTLLPGYDPPSAPVRALTAPGRLVPPRVQALIGHLRRTLARSCVG